MTKKQEARILSNQALIMRALAFLAKRDPMGGLATAYTLEERIRVIEDFKS